MLDLQILVVDEHRDACRALVNKLEQHGYRVCGVETEMTRVIELGRSAHIALIALSRNAGFDAVALAKALQQQCDVALLYVVDEFDEELLRRARESNPNGFILQPYTSEALYGALEVTRPLLAREPIASYARELNGAPQLTTREREIFQAMLDGVRPTEIARAFYISVHTVRRHAQAVFRKLDVHSQIELMNRYGGGGPRRKSSSS